MTQEITPHGGRTTRVENLEDVKPGQWFHVVKDPDDDSSWLGCVMRIGSNCLHLRGPKIGHSYSETRVHFDDFYTRLRFEPDATTILRENAAAEQAKVNELMDEIQAVTARLGVVPTETIADGRGGGDNALVAVSERADTGAYKQALVKAKDETLPELFKRVRSASEKLAGWMAAESLPVEAQIAPMEDGIGHIKDRIYTIGLYAGFAESATLCAEGQPADFNEPLRVMQRRLYMDEECLANYRSGGMSFEELRNFDNWIADPENYKRLLPFERCVAAFRVRRNEKERDSDNTAWRSMMNFQLRQTDEYTYLYVRNGKNIYRVTCDFEFDEMIFPDEDGFNPTQPYMVKMWAGSRVEKIIPLSEYEVRKAEEIARETKLENWKKENPDADHFMDVPFELDRHRGFDYKSYGPLDPSNVYFDEGTAKIDEEVKAFNRIAIILQGLFDRSEILHPHPPVKVWDTESFTRSIELIYDATSLTHGDPPDFETYRKRLNRMLCASSVVTGQDDYWQRREAARENEKNRRNWRNDYESAYTRLSPHGDPGPGLVGYMASWMPRARKAVFKWEREPMYSYRKPPVPCSIKVPASKLLNVTAYTPGDFKQFFADPRTRQDYLKWAPLLLAAEDYYAEREVEK